MFEELTLDPSKHLKNILNGQHRDENMCSIN